MLWAQTVGCICSWNADTSAHLRATWSRVFHTMLTNNESRGAMLDSGVKPASLLYNHWQNSVSFFRVVDQIVEQLSVMAKSAAPTLSHLMSLWPEMPFREMCWVLCGIPYFGEGGQAGYGFNGPYQTHADRQPAFWCKEIILDMLGTNLFGSRRADQFEWTPVGGGARMGLAMALDLASADAEQANADTHTHTCTHTHTRIKQLECIRAAPNVQFPVATTI